MKIKRSNPYIQILDTINGSYTNTPSQLLLRSVVLLSSVSLLFQTVWWTVVFIKGMIIYEQFEPVFNSKSWTFPYKMQFVIASITLFAIVVFLLDFIVIAIREALHHFDKKYPIDIS